MGDDPCGAGRRVGCWRRSRRRPSPACLPCRFASLPQRRSGIGASSLPLPWRVGRHLPWLSVRKLLWMRRLAMGMAAGLVGRLWWKRIGETLIPDGLIDFEDKEEVRSSEETDALEEARLAIEQVVIPEGESVQLLPRPPSFPDGSCRKFQAQVETIGQEPNASLRILPQFVGMEEGSMAVKQEATTGLTELTDSERSLCSQILVLTDSERSNDMNYTQNGIRRLPFLPD
ncbi:hypothetical protein GUJ93_ZPchr0006g42468 [Zizania palustris]|uniref:Uncharacterized protein n=1 Tax=Zizania palustris TaxID=103762 RepID=A0A8J5T1Z4_ZIZPA|nr:hypothetical protein GUJ93_ZPchr0006g42468 [Zizania palustris]